MPLLNLEPRKKNLPLAPHIWHEANKISFYCLMNLRQNLVFFSQGRGVPFQEEAYEVSRESFVKNSLSIVDHYRKAGLLMEINGEDDMETVFKRSATALQLSMFRDLKVSGIFRCDLASL